jgi:hypothetical protein
MGQCTLFFVPVSMLYNAIKFSTNLMSDSNMRADRLSFFFFGFFCFFQTDARRRSKGIKYTFVGHRSPRTSVLAHGRVSVVHTIVSHAHQELC